MKHAARLASASSISAHFCGSMHKNDVPSGINKWAKGSALPNAYQLVAVCHALDLDVDVFILQQSYTGTQ